MKQLHHPKDIRTFSAGANYDINKEFLTGDKGTYIDACNMRPTDMSKDNGALKKIKGEEVIYDQTNDLPPCATTYGVQSLSQSHECILTIEINNKIVEFWACRGTILNPSQYPAIKIDGIIVAQSQDIPFTVDNLLQGDKNEACVGGEIYVTDNVAPPMFFNVIDLQTNAGIFDTADCSDKYFGGFNIEAHQISIENTINAPRFEDYTTTNSYPNLDDSNQGNGLDVGVYAYAVRFLDEVGNRTEISEFTPTIPAYASLSAKTSIHPWAYTYGGDVGDTTTLGFTLIIRGDSTGSFKECEVIRIAWNAGDPILTTTKPEGFVVGRFELDDDSIKNYRFLDRSMDSIEAISSEEATLQLMQINRAKAVRFFENRLYFMNVGIGGSDADIPSLAGLADDEQVNGYACVQHMFKGAHNDPWQFAYLKSYMNNERHGYGVVFRDANGSRTYTQQLKFDQGSGLKDFFEFPTKREAMSNETIDVSYQGCAYLPDNDNGLNNVHEPFWLVNPKARTYRCYFLNILDKGEKSMSRVFGSGTSFPDNPSTVWSGCYTGYDSSYKDPITGKFNTKKVYGQLSPKNLAESSLASSYRGHHWQPIQKFYADSSEKTEDFDPVYMHSPDYYSMGLAIEKINPPSWATSFSIVRTEAALKVQASGIAVYDVIGGEGNQSDTNKSNNKVIFYASDIDTNNGLYSNLATEIEDAPQNYKLVLDAPMGFNTELYSGNRDEGRDEGIDMITFAMMQMDEKNSLSPKVKPYLLLDDSTEPLTSGDYRYVVFGRWRNNTGSQVFTSLKKKFDITSVEYVQGDGTRAGDRGGHYWRLTLVGSIYQNRYVSNKHHFNKDTVKEFHEPFYAASIVNENLEPPSGRNASYVSTGHVQQMNSAFYLSKGQPFAQQLVDERWEDCIQDTVYDNNLNYTQGGKITGITNDYSKYRRFVYQDLGDGSSKRAWVHARFLTAQEIDDILTQASTGNAGSVALNDGSLQSEQVWGVYNDSWGGQNYKNQKPTLIFDSQIIADKGLTVSDYSVDTYVPQAGSTIYVEYDNRIPLRVFGGDTFHTESTFVMADLKFGNDSKPIDDANELRFNVGMPYGKYLLNERNIILNRTQGTNLVQNQNVIKYADNTGSFPMLLRQWLILFVSSSRTPKHTQYMKPSTKDDVNQFYPLVHYRSRPHKWEEDDAIGAQTNIKSEYYDDLGDEDQWWNYGGFRFMSTINQDYAAANGFHEYAVKVIESIEDETEFCTRVIWSDIKQINIQDSPNTRSFPSLNFFDISDDTGEIKYAYDSDSNKGNNLYAITDSGVCLLLTNKRTLHEANGNELSTLGTESQGVLKQVWIDKHIGMPDEHWRSAAESPIALYWGNKDSIFRMTGNEVKDIGRSKYHTILNPKLKSIGDGYSTKLTGVYNKFHNEYWLNFECGENPLDGFAFGTINAGSSGIAWIWDYTINGGQILPSASTNFIGNIGVDPALGENGLMLTSQNPPTLWLGGQYGDLISPNADVKICVDEGSQPFSIYEPIDQITHVINPSTCKCFKSQGGSRSDGTDDSLRWEISSAVAAQGKVTPYTPCYAVLKSKPYNNVGYITNMDTAGWGTSGAATANTVINYTCNNCTVDNVANITISSDGQEANATITRDFLAVFKVEIHQRNASGTLVLNQTFYTAPTGCSEIGNTNGSITGSSTNYDKFTP